MVSALGIGILFIFIFCNYYLNSSKCFYSVTDLLYRQTVTINNSPLEVEIIDVSGETVGCIKGYLLVFK